MNSGDSSFLRLSADPFGMTNYLYRKGGDGGVSPKRNASISPRHSKKKCHSE
jgi:hypothetical protein